MKTKNLFLMGVLLLGNYAMLHAQRAFIREKIRKDIEKKYEPEKKRGREEIDKITYENDTRYKNPYNKVQATIAYENRDYNKKGKITTTSDKLVFGKHGEAMIMSEGAKNESWVIFNYAEKANYMVDYPKKRATKMPLINMKKMVERAEEKEKAKHDDRNPDGWVVTEDVRVINGYNCRKYIYTYPSNHHLSSLEAWIAKDVKLNIDDNYLLGARVNSYKFAQAKTNKNVPNGMLILGISYDKKGNINNERELKTISKTADERYFDMSQFTISDVVDMLD